MPRYIAFLRAINVGGRNVKMDELRRVFESLGFAGVETFIASGNVVFEARAKGGGGALERKIEGALREALGYEVTTFVRTQDELAAVAGHRPFRQSDRDAATLYVAFLKDVPDGESQRKLTALKSDVDDFRVRGREVYWLCRARRQSDSKFSNAVLEKVLGGRATIRGANTVAKMAEKYCSKGAGHGGDAGDERD